MARRARREVSPLEQMDARFEGTRYSNQECEFLLEHFGEAPIVAIPDDEDLPEGVNEAQVRPILQRTFDLELYQESLRAKHETPELVVWCGFDRLREVLEETLKWNRTVAELKRRTKGSPDNLRRAAGAPSLHMWDGDTDIPYLGGEGADSQICLTALTVGGERIALYCELKESGDGAIKSLAGVANFINATSATEQSSRIAKITPNKLIYKETAEQRAASIECPICHAAEAYDTLKASTKRQALVKMRHHLKVADIQKAQHRLLLTRLQSGKAGTAERTAAQRAKRNETAGIPAEA